MDGTAAAASSPAGARRDFYVTGGTVPQDAASYVTRRADRELLDGLLAGDYCYVLNTRQMGKSSLSVRTMAQLSERGVRTVFLDLTKIGGQNATPDHWYAGLMSETGRALGLRSEFIAYARENRDQTHVLRLFGALREIALPRLDGPLVIFVDEVDAVRSLPFPTDEFFAAVRECYTARATEPEMNRLTFCLLGVATPADLISDTRMSPFNIGRRIHVKDFTPDEAAPLASGLGRGGDALLARVLHWTGGHPYLTQRLCRAAVETGVRGAGEIDRLCHDLFLTRTAQETDDNLSFVRNRLLKSEADLAALLDLYRRMRGSQRVPDDETNPLCAVLKLSGVAKVENGLLRVRNRIYEHVFDRAWVEQHLPDAEKRRQRQAFQRGVLLTGGVAGLVLLVVAGLGAFAARNYGLARRNAQQATAYLTLANRRADEMDYNLYVARMNLMGSDWESNNIGHMRELLEATKARGAGTFEWNYWNRLCNQEKRVLTGHKGGVTSVAHSPDGRYFATGGTDKMVRLWDAGSGICVRTLKEEAELITSIAFSPDSKHIVTGSSQNNIWYLPSPLPLDKKNVAKIWDVESGRCLKTITGRGEPVFSVAFSPDGGRLLVAADLTISIYDAHTGKILNEVNISKIPSDISYHAVYSAAFSPDGKHIGVIDANAVILWNASANKTVQIKNASRYASFSIAFSSDGKQIVIGSWDAARILDVSTGNLLRVLKGHVSAVRSVVFSSNNRYVLTGSDDSTVKIWSAATGKCLNTLKGHGASVRAVTYSPNGRQIIAGGQDGTIRQWNAGGVQETLSLAGHTYGVLACEFSPNGKQIATSSFDGNVRIWDAATGQSVQLLKGDILSPVRSLAYSPSGQHLVTGGSGKGGIRLWDVRQRRCLRTLKAQVRAALVLVMFSPDGRRIFVADGPSATVLDARTGSPLLMLRNTRTEIMSAAYSSDGKRLLTSDKDSTRIWDAKSGLCLLTVKEAGGYAATFSPDGISFVTTTSNNNTVKVWDVYTGALLHVLKGHAGEVRSAAYSSDGTRIATASYDNTARLWDSRTGECLLTLPHGKILYSVAFSPDGRRLVTGCDDGTAFVWFADGPSAAASKKASVP